MLKEIGVWYCENGWLLVTIIMVIWTFGTSRIKDMERANLTFYTGWCIMVVVNLVMVMFKYVI